MNILIVEDEPLVRSSLSRMVRDLSETYRVEDAEDGQDAIELLNQIEFDLVITDIRMPAVDGLKLAKHIHHHFPQIHVVLLTGYAEFDYALQALRENVFDYLLKPTSKESIVHVIQKSEKQRKEWSFNYQIERLRQKDMLEKRVQDMLYEMPLPYYDKDLLPSFETILVFSLNTERDVLWQKPVRFFIKNVLQDPLIDLGTAVVVVEERHLTVVLFSSYKETTEIHRKITESVQRIEEMLRIKLNIGFGGSSEEVDEISYLYLKSLKELGILDSYVQMKEADSIHRLVRSALNYIEAEYAIDLSLTSIADRLDVHPNYLSSLIRSETGLTFTQHLTNVRLVQAKKLLRETNMKIYQISNQVGYSDQAYFSRLFKITEGSTPYEYREQVQQSNS